MSSQSIATPDAAPRAVIVISSHVVRGSVGNRAAVFALETLGFPVWAVPTITMPWHPGHGPSTRIVASPEQFAALMADLERAPWLGEVGAVLSGYLGDAGPATMLVTSAPAMLSGSIGNLLVDADQAVLAEHRVIDRPPNGLGDLTAAVYLARVLGGQPPAKALQTTTAAVYEILARTARRGGDELQLETDAQSLAHPMALVQLRNLQHPGRDRTA
jgi:pyridoxine kinase